MTFQDVYPVQEAGLLPLSEYLIYLSCNVTIGTYIYIVMCQTRTKNTPFPANLLSTINFYLFIIYIDPLLAEGLRASLPGVHTKNIYTFKTRPVHSTLHISEENKQRRNTSAAASLQNMTLQIILEH